MPELQKKNNLVISNQPWQPPTQPLDNWTPPTNPIQGSEQQTGAEEDTGPSKVRELFDWANKPMLDITSPAMREMTSRLGEPGLNDSVLGAQLKGFTSGGIQGLADFISSQSSPLMMGLEATGAGAVGAAANEAPVLSRALQLPGQLATGGMVAHGVGKMATDPDWIGKLGGLSEAAMGGAGLAHLMKGRPTLKPSGSMVPPIEPKPNLPPEFTAVGEEPAYEAPKFKPTEELRYEIARQAQKMGLDKPLNITTEKSEVKKPIIKDYWITNKEGKKVLNPKYQNFGKEAATFSGGTNVPAPEPYFIKNEQGKLVANPNHPALKTEQPQAARVQKNKGASIGQNLDRSIDELTTGYSAPLHQIMIREGMQNAIDAVRSLGKEGRIGLSVDIRKGTITIGDNGKGMTRHELQTVYTNLHESGKVSETGATGGKGIGKATYILGGEYFKVETVREMRGQKVKMTMEGTPVDIKKGVPINYQVVPPDTQTGTIFTTKLKKDQNAYTSLNMADKIIKSSRNIEATVSYDPFGADNKHPKDYQFLSHKDDQIIGSRNIQGNDVKVLVPKDRTENPIKDRNNIEVYYLNNGMYQFKEYMHLDKNTPHMPDHVLVDIHPSAEEGSPEYPFPTQRESIKKGLKEHIDAMIHENLINPQKEERRTKLRELYAAMTPISGDKSVGRGYARQSVMYDPGDRLTPAETTKFQKSYALRRLSEVIDNTIADIINAAGEQNWSDRLERTGFILHPDVHGYHIPNPDTGKSAILQNPFPNIETLSPKSAAIEGIVTSMHEVAHIGLEKGGENPVVTLSDFNKMEGFGQYLDTYFKEVAAHGNINPGHAIEFITRLGDIYGTFGPERFNKAVNKYHSAITDANGNYTAEIQNLLSIYKESRGRQATTEDFLSRTGERQEPPSGGKGNIRSNDKSNTIRANREPKPEVIDKLLSALREAGPKRATQEDLYSVERAKRIQNAQKVNTGGLTGFYKQLHELKGELPKVDYERTKLSTSDVNDLLNEVDKSGALLPYEKIRAKMGLLKMLTAKREEVPQFSELKLLRQVFGAKFDQVIEMHGGLGVKPNMQIVKDIANMPKAIMASIDMSAPLRQGLPLIHKAAWRDNIIPMIKMFKSQDVFDATMQSIKDRPNYLLGKQAGLKLTDIGNQPEMREEAYGSKFAEKIPGIKASERAYVGFLNKLRADTFDSLIQDAKDAGLHPKDVMFDIADFVNTASGRGKLPGGADRIAHELNTMFFSPRLIASRVAMMNPATYVNASPFVRKEFLKAALATASAGLTMTGLMSALGAKTSTRLSDTKGTSLVPIPGMHGFPDMPISADFGKSRFGNTRIENYGGFLPYVTYMGRMLSGERESSTTGKQYILGKGFAVPNRLQVTEDFIANKLSPAASLVYKILKQKDPTGKEYSFSPTVLQSLKDISNGDFTSAMKNAKTGEVGDLFVPMFIGDLISIMKDDPKHLPLAAGSFFGMGTQTYGKNPKKSTELRIRP